MAQLIYEIQGTSAGLAKAVNESISLLQNLQLEVNKLSNGAGFTGLGSAIQVANNQALQLNKTLSDTSLSAQDKGGIAALDTLGRKLLTIKGNTELFGDSLRNQQAELGAYQSALNKLLSLGFQPLDGDVTRIKANIDSLTASIAAASAVPVKRVEISNSLTEATAFNASSTSSGPVASSGTAALIAEFDKDLAAGKITAAEYRAEIDRINASQANFARATGVSSAALETEVGILEGLKAELRSLQTAKVSLVNPTDIAKQNALIQELEAEIARFNNVGKVGFDASGVAIKNFGKEAENASKGGVSGLGRGLTSVFGSIRQLAYILPGIGIAGIFSLAFEAIGKATEGLDLFSKKLTTAEIQLRDTLSVQNALNEVTLNAGKGSQEEISKLDLLYKATQNQKLGIEEQTKAAIELQNTYPTTLGNFTTEEILAGKSAEAYKRLKEVILDLAYTKAIADKIGSNANRALADDLAITKEQTEQVRQQKILTQANAEAKVAIGSTVELYAKAKQAQVDITASKKREGDLEKDKQLINRENLDLENRRDAILEKRGVKDFLNNKNPVSDEEKNLIEIEKTKVRIDQDTQRIISDNDKNSIAKRTDSLKQQLADQIKLIDLDQREQLLNTNISESSKRLIISKSNELKVAAEADYQKKIDSLTKSKASASSFLDLNKQIDDLLAKTNNLAQASGLTGYALNVEKITATYIDLNRQVDQFNKKVKDDVRTKRITDAQGAQLLAKSANVTSVLPGNEDKELNDAKIAEAQRVATEIDRINNEFGVKAEQTRGREIAQVEALADKEIDVATKGVFTRTQIEQNYQNAIAKAKGNDRLIQQAELLRTAEINAAQNAADEVVAIQNGKITAIRAINDKYLQIEQDLWDKISIIDTQAQTDVQGITESATAKIVKEWETRREAANKYYAQLKVLAASDLSGLNGLAGFNVNGLVQNAITQKQGQTNTNITIAENVDVNREILKPFTEGITQATRGIVQFFSTFNQQTDQSFTALFTGITSKIESVFNTIFENILDKQLSNALINGITASGNAAQKSLTGALQKGTADGTKHLSTQLSSGLTAALAGVGLLGSTISGLTPKTSIIGQGLGGALSGAASGALIGSAIPGIGTVAGAIIGGGIGLLGGIFGASKAQKELQAQQLAEQKQQTALLKASLAYTSTIIGRMTSQGVVTGVDVGAFGQLTATVSGKDLQFVLDRNNNGR
jgi:hypothetical protein